MRLLLSLLSWPEGGKPDVRQISAAITVGRARDCDWMLPDPASELSRRHCEIVPLGDSWRVIDRSANGTFVNDAAMPLGRDQAHELHDGDRIRLGTYVVEVRHEAPASLSRPPVPEHSPFANPPVQANFADSRWEPMAKGLDEDAPYHGFTGPMTSGADAHDDFLGQPASDHTPAVSHAWHLPPPGRVVIPDDWDLELQEPVPPSPSPQAGPAPRMVDPMPPAPADPIGDQAAEEDRTFVRPLAAMPPAQPALAPDGQALVAAFLRGAGLSDTGGADPLAMMEAVGASLRAATDRLRALASARGAIKREFRILATQVEPEGNNPVKFSANGEAALRSLLIARRPAQLVAEILDETRMHELAMIAAMRDAVQDLLRELDPAPLLEGARDGTLGVRLPVQRKARAFDRYQALYAKIVQAMTDDFDSIFGKAFARSYERVIMNQNDSGADKKS